MVCEISDWEEGLRDKNRSGRPLAYNLEDFRQTIEGNLRTNVRRLATELLVSKSTVWNHLHRIGKANRRARKVPRERLNRSNDGSTCVVNYAKMPLMDDFIGESLHATKNGSFFKTQIMLINGLHLVNLLYKDQKKFFWEKGYVKCLAKFRRNGSF
jgi:hypothetical protein